MKRILCLTLCVLLTAAFAGCGAKTSGTAAVNVIEKLQSLAVTDEALGIAGKYAKLSDIEGGSIDPDLVGTWISADGETTYAITQDGVEKATALGSTTEVPFTCLTIGDYKILCEEMKLNPEFYEGAQEGDTQLSYTVYSVENDAMYRVIVEEVNPDYTSNLSALVTLYRADESGSAEASIQKNPIDLNALNGTWQSDKGSFTIENGSLKSGDDSFKLSFDEKNALVVDKDGVSTVYDVNFVLSKEYDYEDRTQFTTTTEMGIYFTGADENDKPNLLPLLEDYKTEYGYDSWYYTGSFALQ